VHEALDNTLESLDIGAPVSHDPLHLFPLEGGPSEEEALILLDEALEEGMLCVEELGEGGSVPELRVVNAGVRPVLLLEGDELVGAKQNRVVNSSVLVAAASELMLPVSCVERGRWSRRPRAFTGSFVGDVKYKERTSPWSESYTPTSTSSSPTSSPAGCTAGCSFMAPEERQWCTKSCAPIKHSRWRASISASRREAYCSRCKTSPTA
jgi:hypothetical protein